MPDPTASKADPAAATETIASSEPKTMLEAISQGLDKSSTDKPEPKEPAAKPADDDSADADESADDADGEAKPIEDAKPDADKAKPKADKPKVDEKPEDELTPPDGLGEKGQKRFQKLANTNRDLRGELDNYKERWTSLTEIFSENKVVPEQFEMAVGYLGKVNHGDLKGALALLDQERKHLAVMLGEDVAGVDLLSDFPDLKQAVENMELSKERATELAAARSRQQNQNQQQQVEQQQHQSREQFAEQRADALSAIDRFIVEQQKTDLDFAAKAKILETDIVEWCKGQPPQMWLPTVQRMYGLIGKVAKFAPAGSEQRPLRGGGGGQGAKPAPTTMLEAIEQGVFAR